MAGLYYPFLMYILPYINFNNPGFTVLYYKIHSLQNLHSEFFLRLFSDQKALVQLRRTEKLEKLIFLSCDPKAAVKNFVDLGRHTSKNYSGSPLVPIRAVPVDMFPHTSHCELIVYFERLDLQKMDGNEQLKCENDVST